jgi:hypothetical protein
VPVETRRSPVPTTFFHDYVGYIYRNDYGFYISLVSNQDGYIGSSRRSRSRSKLLDVS